MRRTSLVVVTLLAACRATADAPDATPHRDGAAVDGALHDGAAGDAADDASRLVDAPADATEPADAEHIDAAIDARPDAAEHIDAAIDARPDARPDAAEHIDAAIDARPDAPPDAEVIHDAPPDAAVVPDPTVLVVRLDSGGGALTGSGAAVVLEKLDAVDGTVLDQISLPTTTSGASNSCVISGTATTEGYLARSSDGRFASLACYATTVGAATSSSHSNTTPRIVARIDASGVVDTSTAIPNAFDAGNVRGAVSTDGSKFWVTGSKDGVQLVTFASVVGSITLSTGNPINLRAIIIAAGQLFVNSASSNVDGVATVGAGVPTTPGQAITILPGFPTASGPNPSQFVALDTDSTPGVDTIYEAQASASSTASSVNVQKWTLVAGTWTQVTAFLPTTTGSSVGTFGLAAVSDHGKLRLVASTSDGHVVTFVDDGSTQTPACTSIATAPTNSIFRGVAASPTP